MRFPNKISREKGIRSKWLDKTKQKHFTVNKPNEYKDQALTGTNRDKYKQVKEDISLSRSSISKSKGYDWS